MKDEEGDATNVRYEKKVRRLQERQHVFMLTYLQTTLVELRKELHLTKERVASLETDNQSILSKVQTPKNFIISSVRRDIAFQLLLFQTPNLFPFLLLTFYLSIISFKLKLFVQGERAGAKEPCK